MENRYNLYNLEPSFKNYLITVNISPLSLKNYLSDLRYFFGWVLKTFETNRLDLTNQEAFFINLTTGLIQEYRTYLINNSPLKTANRRLSTIRKFCSFAVNQSLLAVNPAKNILNLVPEKAGIIDQFKTSLVNEKFTTDEIKKIISDISDFL